MRRVLLSGSILLAIGAFVFLSTGASNPKAQGATYKIEFDNAFGLVTGSDFKVDGVRAGTIKNISLDQKTLNALVTVNVTQPGLAAFHSSATCDSEPQSLIGEYFVSCQPGTSGPLLKDNATIPVTHTTSTIPADLLLDIMRLPERQGFQMIINSLGAGVAARSGDLQAALDRAVPALRETDKLLNLLGNDSHTLQNLTASSDHVVTALANNTGAIDHFIQYAGNAAKDTATQRVAFAQTWHDLPGFLAQLRPAMRKLGEATTTNTPVLANLHASAAQLDTLFSNLPGFAHSSLPALRALGKASVTGKVALTAAKPTIAQLKKFAQPTPELAKNLSIVLPDLDTQKNATERNRRSPGGKGYSGLQALLQFVFNLSGATSYYGPFGHELAVDAFVSNMCSPFADAKSVAAGLKQYGPAYRRCYAWLGPDQPGINMTDPSNPHACVPDPGGLPPGQTRRPNGGAPCKLSAASDTTAASRSAHTTHSTSKKAGAKSSPKNALSGVGSTINKIVSMLSGSTGTVTKKLGSTVKKVGSKAKSTLGSLTGGSGAPSGSSSGTSQTQQLLNYLLAP